MQVTEAGSAYAKVVVFKESGLIVALGAPWLGKMQHRLIKTTAQMPPMKFGTQTNGS
jgi:hypothetical protein